MRYILLIAVCLTDILLIIGLTIMVFFADWTNPIAWLVTAGAIYSWKRSGGFDNWRPKYVREYLKNAKGYGL